ncbi:MAG TPA: TIGR03435 family protein [Bryobacteraceae bacterium]|nr:TIGR03435 family protein [Bryobacteraceae bacterium]
MKRALASAGLFLSCVTAFGQQAAAPLSFDVAEVKMNKSGARGEAFDLLPGGQLSVRNVTMKQIIAGAYNVGDYAISGGPGWLDSDRFDIVAKAAPGTSEDNLRLMAQTLLADRLKLAVHRDQKTMSVYALVVAKRGSKLQPSPGGSGEADCNGRGGRLTCTRMSMADLAEALPRMAPRYIDMPVVDLTELKGVYDFTLEWSPLGGRGGAGRGTDAPATADAPPSTIFDAVQDLGLKLEGRKHPVTIIVIDHIERIPAEN